MQHKRSQDASPAPSILAGKRILIVEDHALVAMELAAIVKGLGAVIVGPAGRLHRALAMAEREPIDAALLDVDLDGVQSWPVADALASRNIPFAFTTGFAASSILQPAFAGARVISKPYGKKAVRDLLLALFAG